MSIVLVGPHAYLTSQLDATDKDWIGRSSIVKAIDDPAPLDLADQRAITVYRETDETNLFETLTNKLVGHRRPTFVEGKNEWKSACRDASGNPIPDLDEHIAWMQIYAPRCHDAGLKVAGFSIAVGNLDPEGVVAMMAANWAGVDAVSYHAYWAMQGPVSDWTTYRYRRWYAQTGGHMPPVIITEAGRDAIVQEGGDKKPGWMLQDISAEQYYAEWVEFDRQLQTDAQKRVIWQGREYPLVLGATGFALRGTDQWRNYELAPLSAWFARDSVITTTGGGTTVAIEWTLGFADYAKTHVVGTPVEALQYDDQGNAWQHSDIGLLFWHKAANTIHWFARPKA